MINKHVEEFVGFIEKAVIFVILVSTLTAIMFEILKMINAQYVELADLLLSWYQSGYQAGRYHALREMNSSRTNGYNYAYHYGRNSPVGSNMNSGSSTEFVHSNLKKYFQSINFR